jgi:hypothetical protein
MKTAELNNWLINAFNGEWLRTANAEPLQVDTAAKAKRKEKLKSTKASLFVTL